MTLQEWLARDFRMCNRFHPGEGPCDGEAEVWLTLGCTICERVEEAPSCRPCADDLAGTGWVRCRCGAHQRVLAAAELYPETLAGGLI